jgi:hypothetical protein
MPNEIVPIENQPEAPHEDARQGDNEDGDRGRPDGKQRRRRRKSRISSREELMLKLDQLPGLVLLKVITTAEANAITRAVQAQLAEMRSAPPAGSSPQFGEHIVGILRAHPEMQELFEPLLTDEQVESIMRDVTDDDKSET